MSNATRQQIETELDMHGLLWVQPVPGMLEGMRDTTPVTVYELPRPKWLMTHAHRHHRSRRLDQLHEPSPVHSIGS